MTGKAWMDYTVNMCVNCGSIGRGLLLVSRWGWIPAVHPWLYLMQTGRREDADEGDGAVKTLRLFFEIWPGVSIAVEWDVTSYLTTFLQYTTLLRECVLLSGLSGICVCVLYVWTILLSSFSHFCHFNKGVGVFPKNMFVCVTFLFLGWVYTILIPILEN